MSKTAIVEKALKCIDEIYPSDNTLNGGFYELDTFVNEAARYVIDIVPAYALGSGEKLQAFTPQSLVDGVVKVTTTEPELSNCRVIYVKVSDWAYPVLNVIRDTHPRYIQQRNRVLRGTPEHPIVALVEGGTTLELYTTDKDKVAVTDIDVRYVNYDAEAIPDNLIDITAWKLAEIVLMSMSDTQNATVCSARVAELLQQIESN